MAVNGRWGGWSGWSNCTEECGGGAQSRLRICNDPAPKYGGDKCTTNAIIGIDHMDKNIQVQSSIRQCNENFCGVGRYFDILVY